MAVLYPCLPAKSRPKTFSYPIPPNSTSTSKVSHTSWQITPPAYMLYAGESATLRTETPPCSKPPSHHKSDNTLQIHHPPLPTKSQQCREPNRPCPSTLYNLETSLYFPHSLSICMVHNPTTADRPRPIFIPFILQTPDKDPGSPHTPDWGFTCNNICLTGKGEVTCVDPAWQPQYLSGCFHLPHVLPKKIMPYKHRPAFGQYLPKGRVSSIVLRLGKCSLTYIGEHKLLNPFKSCTM